MRDGLRGLPAAPGGAGGGKLPVLYWLSGLTCTWENFTEKAGAQRYAAEHGLILVAPDTSPRGVDLPGEDDAYDFGSAPASTSTPRRSPGRAHYRMYSYVTAGAAGADRGAASRPIARRQGIFGHSMGGHGALVCALRNPERYRSVSAFAPIARPMRCPWGEKALSGYLGADRAAWRRLRRQLLAAGADWRRRGPGRPGHRRRFPGRAAQARAPPGGLPRRRHPADAPPPGGLRPQLLFHGELHGRAHR